MVNKLTIETAYKQDPFKSYFVIQNPQLDTKKKKITGLKIKQVEYKVQDWDQKIVRFKKVNILKDKKFPEIIEFDKRYPDAENEVHVEDKPKNQKKSDESKDSDTSKKKKKTQSYTSYGIFIDEEMAEYNKLIRLHRLATDMLGYYNAFKKQKEESSKASEDTAVKPTDSGADSKGNVVSAEATAEIQGGVDSSKIDLTIDEVKKYFESIQDTEYYDRLEELQANNPSLATR